MELNTILNICIAYNLTFDEFFLIYMTLLARDEEGHAEYISKWFSNGGNNRLKDLFNSLKEKGIIHKSYNPEVYNPNDVEFNKNFIKGWYKQSGEMGQELFDEYPPFITINGKVFSLRNIAKKFYSLDDFYFYYSSNIGHNPEKHKEVMELLKWGKENDLIRVGILEFVASHKWDELKYLKENNLQGQVASSFNVYESI